MAEIKKLSINDWIRTMTDFYFMTVGFICFTRKNNDNCQYHCALLISSDLVIIPITPTFQQIKEHFLPEFFVSGYQNFKLQAKRIVTNFRYDQQFLLMKLEKQIVFEDNQKIIIISSSREDYHKRQKQTKKLQLLSAKSKNIKKRWANELQFQFFKKDQISTKIQKEAEKPHLLSLSDLALIGSPILSSRQTAQDQKGIIGIQISNDIKQAFIFSPQVIAKIDEFQRKMRSSNLNVHFIENKYLGDWWNQIKNDKSTQGSNYKWQISSKSDQYKITGSVVQKIKYDGLYYQIVSQKPLQKTNVVKMTIRVRKNQSDSWICFGLLKKQLIQKQWSGHHLGSIAFWSLNQDRQGFVDNEGAVVKRSPYFWLNTGQKLTMVVSQQSQRQIQVKWQKGQAELYSIKLDKSWKDQDIYPFLVLWKKGDSIEFLD